MTSSARLELSISSQSAEASLRRMEGRLNDVDRAGDRAERSMQGLSGSLGGVRTVAMAAGGLFAALGISSFGREVFNTVASVEKMRASLTTVTGSIESASAAWDQMREFAKTTPFELDQAVQGFIRMKSLGLDPTESSMRSFANTAAAMNTDLMQMIEAVADATTGEFERLKEYGIRASQDGDRVALTFQGVTTSIGNNAREIKDYLENIGNTNFADAAIAQMDTLGGKANNLGDAIDELYRTIGEAGATGLFNAALDGSAEAVELLTNNVETLAIGVEFLGDVAIIAAGVYTGRFVSAMAAGTVSLATKTKASIADTRAESAAAAAVVRRTGAEKQAALALLSTTRLEEQATRGTVAHTFALQQLSVARTRAATATGIHARATAVATAATAQASFAARGLSGALSLVGGPVGAAVLAGAAAYYFRDALGFASAEARETKQEVDQLVDSLDGLTRAQYQNNQRGLSNNLSDARFEAEKLEAQIAKLQDQASQESVMYQGRGGASTSQITRLQAELQEQNRIVQASEEGLRRYEQAWDDLLESQVTGASIFRTLDQWLMDTGDSANNASTQFDALNYTLGTGGEKWDDYIGKLQAARDVMGLTAAEAANYAAVQQGFTGLYAQQAGAVAGQTAALEDYRSAVQEGNSVEAAAHLERARRYSEAEAMVLAQLQNIDTLTNLLKGVQTELSATALSAALVVGGSAGSVSALLSDAVAAINERASAIQRTTTVTKENTAANRAAEAAERERIKTLDDSISAYADLFKELSPVGAAQAEYNETVARLAVAHEDGTKSAIEYYAAIGQAAAMYNESVAAADPSIKRVEELSNQYDRAYVRGQQLTTAIDDINAAYRRGDIDGQQYGRMIQGVRDEMAELALEADPMAQEMARAWEEASNRIDETFADAFAGAFDSFDDFGDQLLDGFKRLLAELAYQATLKPIVVAFTGDMQSMMGIGGGAAGGGLNFSNTVGAAKNLWGAGSSLLGGGASTAAAGYSAGTFAGSATGAYSGWAGSAAAGAGAAGAGGGVMSAITSGVSAAMPWIAGGLAIDSMLGGSITKAISGIFGGSWETKDGGLQLGVAGGDITGNEYEKQRKSGGLFSGSSYRTKTSDLDGEFETALSQTYQAQQLALRASLDTLGQQSSALNSFSAGLEKISTKGKSDAEVEQAVQDWLQGIVNSAAQSVVDPAEYALAGETTVATLSRLATALTGVNPILEQLHGNAFAASLAGGDAAASLVALSGGMEQFTQRADYYYQNFYSEAERQEAVMDQAALAMGAFTARTGGIVTTTDQLRALVDGIDRNSVAGRELYAAAMQLAPALVEVENGLERVKDRFADMLNEAESALGSAEQQARSAWKAFENQSFGQRITLLEAVGDAETALALQRERELQGIDPLLHETQRFIWAMEDEAEAKQGAIKAAQNYRSEIERVRSELSNTLGGISQWIDQRTATAQTPGLNLEAAGEQFARQLVLAESGDRSALQSITQYADQYLSAGEQMFASGGAFQSIQEEVLGALKDLPEQISSEEYLAQEIRDALQSVVISAMPTDERLAVQLSNELVRLDTNQLTAAQVRNALAPHATDAEISRLIREVDVNGDGIITKQELVNQRLAGLASGIGSTLAPMFDSIDLDASGLIDWNEFYSVFAGMASDKELRRIFQKLDADGSGTISRLEALNRSNEGTESNTENLEERARDQLRELNGLVGEMGRTTNQFVGLNSNMVSLRDSINALGVAQAEVAKIEKARLAAEKAEKERLQYQREQSSIAGSFGQQALEALAEAQKMTLGDGVNGITDKRTSGIVGNFMGYAGNDHLFQSGEYKKALEDINNRYAKGWYSDLEKTFAETALDAVWKESQQNQAKANASGNKAAQVTTPVFGGIQQELQALPDIERAKMFFERYDDYASSWKIWRGTLGYDWDKWGGNILSSQVSDNDLIRLAKELDTDFAGPNRFFANGGYTGPGGKYEPAGIVHAGEVVWSQDDISRFGGVGAVESLRTGSRQMPMPDMPMPQFPQLGNADVVQALKDLRNENKQLRSDINRLLGDVKTNTGNTANAVASSASRAERQRNAQLEESRAATRAARLKVRTP